MGIFVLMNNLKLAQYAASELLLLLQSLKETINLDQFVMTFTSSLKDLLQGGMILSR